MIPLPRFARRFVHTSVQSIASVVEMDNCIQTLEVTVVPVRLHEIGAGPLVYVSQSRDLNFAVEFWREWHPVWIWVLVPTDTGSRGLTNLLTEAGVGKKASHP